MATIQEIVALTDFAEIKKQLSVKPEFTVSQEDAKKQYDVNQHKVFSKTERPDKTVTRPTGQKNDDGSDKTETSVEFVTRVGLAYQELIVDRSVGFMLGNPVEFKSKFFTESEQGTKLFKMIQKVWDDNKMDMVLPEVAERLFREMEVALIFYFTEEEGYWGDMSKSKFRIKSRICSSELGDTLYPHFDETGDMDALTRSYIVTVDGKKIEHFDIYTAEKVYKWDKSTGEMALTTTIDSPGKITAVYFQIKQPDWHKVQSMIERLELNYSNHGDTNDYNGAPILFTKGKLSGAPAKGSRGKALTGDSDADAKYLSWDSAPESIKLENENLKDGIMEITQTAAISFNTLLGKGLPTSGVALKLLFTDSHMKAKKNWRTFGVGVQRMINVIKACICRTVEVSLAKEESNLTITPICTPYLPVNEQEIATILDNGVASGGMSKRTYAENHPFISDADQELERLKEDETGSMEGSVK
jgi:SPP1 family phage portal protein